MINRWKYVAFVFSIATTSVLAQTNTIPAPGFTADILQWKPTPYKRPFSPVFFSATVPALKTTSVMVPVNKIEPFFCKLESGLEKKSGMPVRIRLGSVDYVDYLEGKTQ